MSGRAAVARLSELPRIPGDSRDEPAWTPVRHALGIRAFGVNAWHGERAGDVVIESHDEIPQGGDPGGHEELYLVFAGRARFSIDGETTDAEAGTLIALPPHVRRGAVALADETVVLAVGAPRGEAFVPSAWERRAIDAAGLV
jgi:quercetin dioxygenase-like cupin family protein